LAPDTREELKEYGSDLAALTAESFPNAGFRHVRPDRRREPGHLLGYDPKAAPKFARRLEDTGHEYADGIRTPEGGRPIRTSDGWNFV
jgi:hypothetical protein